MGSIAVELVIILALVLANGVFAMAEIAVVSSRRSRLRAMAESGDQKAAAALDLAESPNRFLATVQIGITLVGIFAGAFGGARLSEKLAVVLVQIPGLEKWASQIAFATVVIAITYLSLVIGELIPKRLGLANAEGFARLLAGPMRTLSRLTSPIVTFLGISTDGLMRLFGVKTAEEQTVSDEEVRALMREGMRSGNFVPQESAMVSNVLELDHLLARELMTPRSKIIWIQADETHEQIWHKIVVSGHSMFPVYEDSRDNVIGVLAIKSIYANLAAGATVKVRDLMTAPLMVPESASATKLLETFRTTTKHAALLVDEFGHVTGLVTVHDLLEAIVGDMPTVETKSKPRAMRREDGSWLIDAMLDCESFEEAVSMYRLPAEADREYQTLAGYIIHRLGRVPVEGDYFDEQGYRMEVIDMDGNRVDKVLLIPTERFRD